MVSARRSLIFGILTICLSVATFLLILEVGVRVFFPSSVWKPAEQLYQLDPVLGWAYKRNTYSAGAIGDYGWKVDLHTNDDGVTPANSSPSRQPGAVRIMFFGDSTVIGRAVPDEQRIHRVLQKLLKQRGMEAEVINAAVEGYATDQSLLLMKRLSVLYRPDIVIYGLCQNDLAGNLVAVAHGMPKPRFILSRNGGLIHQPPDPTLVSYVREIQHRPRAWSAASFMRRSALYQVTRPYLLPLRAWWLRLQGEDTEERWNVRMYFTNQDNKMSDELEMLEALLTQMHATATAAGARFLFYSHPSLQEVWDPTIKQIERQHDLSPGVYNRYAFEALMKRVASVASDVTYCPMVTSFAHNQSRGPFHLLPFDPHCNPAGYRLTAETLADCMPGY